jgi:hypothetical protein
MLGRAFGGAIVKRICQSAGETDGHNLAGPGPMCELVLVSTATALNKLKKQAVISNISKWQRN